MEYIELSVVISLENEELKEIVIAELAEVGGESFVDSEAGVIAYFQSIQFNKVAVNEILKHRNLAFSEKVIPEQNWNALWESNFEPVIVDDKCLIKAGFHKNLKSYPYEILIDPKMSFGTGHHETTALMISSMFDLDIKEKNVLDMGCGTGVLAIMASMLHASDVLGIDIDEWSYENSLENVQRNNCKNVTLALGNVLQINNRIFDVIIANINRNVLLADIKLYNQALVKGGEVLLSGFYRQDVDIIKAEAEKCNWEFCSFKEKNNWVATRFIKR